MGLHIGRARGTTERKNEARVAGKAREAEEAQIKITREKLDLRGIGLGGQQAGLFYSRHPLRESLPGLTRQSMTNIHEEQP